MDLLLASLSILLLERIAGFVLMALRLSVLSLLAAAAALLVDQTTAALAAAVHWLTQTMCRLRRGLPIR